MPHRQKNQLLFKIFRFSTRMCYVEWFAGSFGRSSGGLTLEIFCTLRADTWTKLQKISRSCSPHRHITFLKNEKFFTNRDGGAFVRRLKRRLKLRYITAVQKGRENWSTALSSARLSGHRNFTEQIACLMRFASAEGGHKSNRLTETKNFAHLYV